MNITGTRFYSLQHKPIYNYTASKPVRVSNVKESTKQLVQDISFWPQSVKNY